MPDFGTLKLPYPAAGAEPDPPKDILALVQRLHDILDAPKGTGYSQNNVATTNATFQAVPMLVNQMLAQMEMNANGRLTVQKPGIYRLWFVATATANGTGQRIVQIRKNGTIIAAAGTPGSANGISSVDVETLEALLPTDYVEFLIYQNSGGALNFSPTGGYLANYIAEYKGQIPA